MAFCSFIFRACCAWIVFVPLVLSAQTANVGINTKTPQSTLDVRPSDPSGNTNEGIQAPRLTKTRLAAVAAPLEGTMVYVVAEGGSFSSYVGSNPAVSDVTAVGYYYFDGMKWMQMRSLWMNESSRSMVQLRNLSDNTTARSASQQIFINDNGNMAIGYNDPRQKLIVEGNVWIGRPMKNGDTHNNVGNYPQWGPYLAFEGTYSDAWAPSQVMSNSDPMAFYRYDRALDESELRLVVGDNPGSYDAFVIGPENGSWIEGALGTPGSPAQFDEAFRFRANGEAFKKGGGTWQTVSDARTKEHVEDYHRGLADLLRVRPVSFNYKSFMGNDKKRHVGVIAQEVEQIAPSMVSIQRRKVGDITDIKAVDPNEFTYMLINAVKELKAVNDALQQQVSVLTQQVKALQK